LEPDDRPQLAVKVENGAVLDVIGGDNHRSGPFGVVGWGDGRVVTASRSSPPSTSVAESQCGRLLRKALPQAPYSLA